jgi:hypothetical protein
MLFKAGALADVIMRGFAPKFSAAPELQSLHTNVQALRDEDVRDITRESSRLPERERRLVLGIVRQFRDQKATSRS